MSAYYENGYVVSRDLAVSNFSSVNSSAILDLSERHTIQVMATVTSTVSLAFALLAIYWFILMRRNFRRDLILLLIVGGGWKSLWFLVFSAFTFANGPVETGMVFCQLSGYFSQIGFVACGKHRSPKWWQRKNVTDDESIPRPGCFAHEYAHVLSDLPTFPLYSWTRWPLPGSILDIRRLANIPQHQCLPRFHKPASRISCSRRLLYNANTTFVVSTGTVLDSAIHDLGVCHVRGCENLSIRRFGIQGVWKGATKRYELEHARRVIH